MARLELPQFSTDNKMVAMLQSGWAKVLNPIIKQSKQLAGVSATCANSPAVTEGTTGDDATMIPFNAIQADLDGSMSRAGSFVVKNDGAFLIGCCAVIDNASTFGATDFFHLQIMQNSNRLAFQVAYGSATTYQLSLHVATGVSAKAGDTLSVIGMTTLADSTYNAGTNLYILRMN